MHSRHVVNRHISLLVLHPTTFIFSYVIMSTQVIEIDIEGSEGETRDNLEKLTGARATPRVFFSGQFFGGADELKGIHESGQLKHRLLESGVIDADESKCSSSLLSVASEKP